MLGCGAGESVRLSNVRRNEDWKGSVGLCEVFGWRRRAKRPKNEK